MKTFQEIIAELLEDARKHEQELLKKNTIEVLDRDITFGIRDKICSENLCSFTECPLFVDNKCINNHPCKGIKVRIPKRFIVGESAENRDK